MSTKTPKRKRASTPITEVTPPAVESAPSAVVESTVEMKAPVAAPASSLLATIGLSSNCTVKDAGNLKRELLQLLDEPRSVAIDARSVERIDTAVVQLLCAFVRDRADRNLGVTWTCPTQPLLDAVRLLGVGSMLALATETSA